MRFSVGNTTDGQPSWWLYGGNNQMVAWAGETFASSYNAKRAAGSFKSGAKTARYEVYQDSGNDWRWRNRRHITCETTLATPLDHRPGAPGGTRRTDS